MDYLSESEDCYFTEEARIAVDNLTQLGLDRDLAIEIMHILWDDHQIYELPEGE